MSKVALNILKRSIWALIILPILYATSALAQAPENAPQTREWLTDQAGVLSAEIIRSLTEDAKSFETRTSNQVVVVTVKSLDGWSIERYGRWLGNEWGIGQADKNNGVLLLVAPNERKVRIEVGLGLESTLTNAAAQRIIDYEILPRFRSGDLPAGIVAGHRAILKALSGASVHTKLERKNPFEQDRPGDGGSSFWDKILQIILIPFAVIARLFGFGGRGSSGGGFSGGGGSFGGGGASGSW